MADVLHLSLPEAAERLGVHYMTAYRYVRTGQLHAVREGASWRVDVADLDAVTLVRHATTPGTRHTVERSTRLVDRLCAGDGPGAWSIVEGAMASGADPTSVYLNLLSPALRAIGTRWLDDEVSIAQEHRASVVVTQIVGRLGPRFARRGRARGSVVLGLASGDHHALASLLLADLLRHAGFEPLNLGANTPPRSFVETALGADRLVAVLIGVMAPDQDESVRDVMGELRDAAVLAPILVGGGAIEGEEHARRLGADQWSGHETGAVLRVLEDIVTHAPGVERRSQGPRGPVGPTSSLTR